MLKLVKPSNITSSSSLADKTITITWKNNNLPGHVTYNFRFLSHAEQGSESKIGFTLSAIKPGEKQTAVLSFKTSADVDTLSKYYPQVMAARQNPDDSDSDWAKEEIKWVIGGSISLNVGPQQLVLSSDDSVEAGIYKGDLDFTDSPVSLITLANDLLASVAIQLPDSIPDIVFYKVSGFYKKDKPKFLQVNALADVTIPNPFGLRKVTIGFSNMLLSVAYGTVGNETYKSLGISGDIVYTAGGQSPAQFGSAVVILGTGVNIIGLEITREISAAAILATLLSIEIPEEIAFFLPSFRPFSAEKPIRLYKASKNYTYNLVTQDGKIYPKVFTKGFNLDQLIIHVVGLDFYVSLQIMQAEPKDQFTLEASTDKFTLADLITFTPPKGSSNKGPVLKVTSENKTISLEGGLLFFPVAEKKDQVELQYKFSYLQAADEFRGEIEYEGIILEQKNPTLGFSWKKKGGFNITKYPINLADLEKALDWAKQFQYLANLSDSACSKAFDKITDLAFNEVIQTSFAFKYEISKKTQKGNIGVDVTGTYTLTVVGNKIDVPLILTIEVRPPKGLNDLAAAFLESLLQNLVNIAKALWDNAEALVELLSLLTLKAIGDAAKTAIGRLACQAGKEALEKAMQSAIDAAAAEAAAAAAAAAAAGTIEAFADVVVAIGGVLAAIAKFFKWIFDSAEQKRQENEAKAKKEKAENEIRSRLNISKFQVAYTEAGSKKIDLNWNAVNEGKTPARGGIYFRVTIKDRSYRLSQGELNKSLGVGSGQELAFGQTYNISVQAFFDLDGNTYSGNKETRSLTTPILKKPEPAMHFNPDDVFKKENGIIDVSWAEVAPEPAGLTKATLKAYEVTLYNATTKTILETKNINKQIDKFPTACTFRLYHLKDDEPAPDPANKYQIWVTAIATDADLNSEIGKCTPEALPWGVDFMQIGYNFKVN